MASRAPLLLLLSQASALRPAISADRISRREASSAVLALCGFPLAACAAGQSQRGAEDPYETVLFSTGSCSSRTPLGACRSEGGGASAAPVEASASPKLLTVPVEEETSELILSLRRKSAENAEKNARLVKETTLSALLSLSIW